MRRFHAVADHRSCSVRDGEVVWSGIDRTGERCSPRCRVDRSELEESDEVVVVDAGNDEFIVLEIVEDWEQHLRDVEDVVVRWFADNWREVGRGRCYEQRGGCCVC